MYISITRGQCTPLYRITFPKFYTFKRYIKCPLCRTQLTKKHLLCVYIWKVGQFFKHVDRDMKFWGQICQVRVIRLFRVLYTLLKHKYSPFYPSTVSLLNNNHIFLKATRLFVINASSFGFHVNLCLFWGRIKI